MQTETGKPASTRSARCDTPSPNKGFLPPFFKKEVLACLLLFLATAARAAPWTDYQLITWQTHTAAETAGLKRLGFTGAALIASGGYVDPEQLQARIDSGLSWYLENTLTDFFSPYHRYLPGRPVTALFDALKLRRHDDPTDTTVFLREPSLADPVWQATVRRRLTELVQAQSRYHPLFYDLADESGIGDLAAAWDADITPASLAAFRAWLPAQYPDLAALNRQWATDFPDWTAVVPELTDAAMARHDDNFSAWSDFKAFMDSQFAGAVAQATAALHAADPTALAGLEGGQVPGWGGYDYARLAPGVDVMEIYDAGNAADLAMAFNPGLTLLRTSFGAGPREAHAAWRSLLHGGRGTIVWDDDDGLVHPDGSPTPRGRLLGDTTAAIRAVSPLLFASQPRQDPVAVLVSQASFRARWMLDHRVAGPAWSERNAEREYEANAWRTARAHVLGLLAQLGVEPSLLSDAMLDAGLPAEVKVLILPQAIALSQPALDAIAAFKSRGGTVLADTEPGLFDAHARRRPATPADLATVMPELWPDDAPTTPQTLDGLAAALTRAGAAPRIALHGPDDATVPGLDIRWFRHGADTILSLQMQAPWTAPPDLVLTLPTPMRIDDPRQPSTAAPANRRTVHLDPIVPTLLRLAAP